MESAYLSRPLGRAVSSESINRDVGKSLRAGGAKIDAGDIRRVRELIERYRPEILPAALREQAARIPEDASRRESNVTILNWPRSGEFRARRERPATPRPGTVPEPVQVIAAPTTNVEVSEVVDRDAELERIMGTLGCTLEAFIDAIVRAHARQASREGGSEEDANREAAKDLRGIGVAIDREGVRRVRRLLERCKPEMLPELLHPRWGGRTLASRRRHSIGARMADAGARTCRSNARSGDDVP